MKVFKFLIVRFFFPTVQARDGLILDLMRIQCLECGVEKSYYVCNDLEVEND